MNQRIKQKIITLAYKYKDIPNAKNKHMSFIVQRSNIITIGFNDYQKTHPISRNLKYKFDAMHSELDAFLKVRWSNIDLSKCELINIRINRFGELRMAKPCKRCLHFLKLLNFQRIWYSSWNGDFYLLEG